MGLELPLLIHRLDGPLELLTQSLGEESLDGHVELLGEDDSQARVNIVLDDKVSVVTLLQ